MGEKNGGTAQCNNRYDELEHETVLDQLVDALNNGNVSSLLFREYFVAAENGFVQRNFELERYFRSKCDGCDTPLLPRGWLPEKNEE